jgi:hypothetical protein
MKQMHWPTGSFGLAVLAFFLPFVTVGCNGGNGSGGDLAKFTGFSMMTDSKIQDQAFKGDWHVMVAFAAIVIALIACAVDLSKNSIATAKVAYAIAFFGGVTSVVVLFMLKMYLDDQAAKEGQGIIVFKYEIGYWVAFICSAAGSGLAWYAERSLQEPTYDYGSSGSD